MTIDSTGPSLKVKIIFYGVPGLVFLIGIVLGIFGAYIGAVFALVVGVYQLYRINRLFRRAAKKANAKETAGTDSSEQAQS